MEDMAQGIASRYRKAFLLHAKCHKEFNSSKMFTPAMASLSKPVPCKIFIANVISCQQGIILMASSPSTVLSFKLQ